MTKEELLAIMRTERSNWEALLAAIGEDRMTQPGVAGNWSVKDIVSHVSAYEEWLVSWLRAAQQGSFPSDSVLDSGDTDQRNTMVYQQTQNLPLQQVIVTARQTYQDLYKLVSSFSEEELIDPTNSEWFVKPYFSKITTVWEAVANLGYDHYHEHIPDLTKWLEAK